MGIFYEENGRVFTLQTRHSTYQMKADGQGVLLHTFYGEKTDNTDLSCLITRGDRGFSGNPFSMGGTDRTYSLDTFPQEYSCFGTGDYRISALKVQNADGSRAVSLRYAGHSIEKGKYDLTGLPAAYGTPEEAETLTVELKDEESGVAVRLYYGVFEELDVITRAARIVNEGKQGVTLLKAASLCLDWQAGDYDWLTFHGRHAMERNLQRTGIAHGVQSIGSVRGASSHHYNPFVMICGKNTDEERGDCYGFSFVYSGEFLMEAEKDQMDQTRLISSIHPDNYAWKLEPG